MTLDVHDEPMDPERVLCPVCLALPRRPCDGPPRGTYHTARTHAVFALHVEHAREANR